MSFSNYIKDNNIFENYRQDTKMRRDFSHSSYKINIENSNLYKDQKPKRNISNRLLTPSYNGSSKKKIIPNYITSFNNINSENNEIINIFDYQDYIFIYKDIIDLLQTLIDENKNNVNKLNKYMKLIYDYINNIENKGIRYKITTSIRKEKSYTQPYDNFYTEKTNDSPNKKNKKKKNIFYFICTKKKIN